MGDEENKEEVKCEECKCVGWKVGFAIFVVLSVLMFILCIVLWVKRNAIHDAVYGKIAKGIGADEEQYVDSKRRARGIKDSSENRRRLRKGGEFFEEGLEGGFEELSAMLSSSNRYC